MDAKDKRIAELETLLKAALEEIARLKERIAVLEKNSSNSSKPPSSDIVKQPKTKPNGKKRKRGAQKGHKQHLRTPFDETKIDKSIELKLLACPTCGGKLIPSNEPPKKLQQVELVDKPFIVTEFRQVWYWCEHCQCLHAADLPKEVEKSGLFGPKLIALTAYLKGRGHMSYTTLKEFFGDALSISVSRGFLAKQVRKASDSLEIPYQKLADRLPHEKHLHVDETGGKENGDKRWTWLFRALGFTVFHVDPSRGSGVLEKLLGKDFDGIISCDFWGAYRKFDRMTDVALQFCWSHLIREVKFLAENKDKKVARYGRRLLERIREMFSTIHRRDELLKRNWLYRMQDHREAILAEAWKNIPYNNDCRLIAERLWQWQGEYFRFIETDIPPTNNLAEQAVRRVVIDRKVTQGTRSDWGNRWQERIWSVLATCGQQGIDVMSFLQSCVESFLHGLAPPSLLRD
jgi:Transposase IS66 family.